MDNKKTFSAIVDFTGLKISLASPKDIESWSHGEITKPETVNYRTLRPEKDGLFDERIFGPTKDWECYCGKYKRIRYKGVVCDKCGVEVTHSRVRRERLGHITLAAPVAHIWFFKGAPSILSLILNISPKAIEGIVYFTHYLVLEVDKEKKKQVIKKVTEKFAQNLTDLDKQNAEEISNLKKESLEETEKIKEKIKQKEAREINIAEIKIKQKAKEARLLEKFAKDRLTHEEIFKKMLNLLRTLKELTVLSEEEYLKIREYQAASFFKAEMGAEALLKVLEKYNPDKTASFLREEIQNSQGQKHIKAIKRLRIIEGIKRSKVEPLWTILSVLPVIPPDLRPMVQLSGGRFATSDLNDLYRRVINRNNRLKHLISLGAPDIILRNEKRMLQEAVDSLVDASHSRKRRVVRKKLRSLTDMLKGKQGRFRQNLLGKRVDYSGRSVIVVGPELKLTQCGLPKEMALEMFKPFVLRELLKRGIAQNVKNAKSLLDLRIPEVFDILEEITKNHPVLLNRAPTLHKLGIQAFYPILIEGSAIRLHPCVCLGYNADFDGDQMAVHIPLSEHSIKECIELMLPSHNLLKPADGSPITVPNKGMVLGIYYLTTTDEDLQTKNNLHKHIYSKQEALLAWQLEKIGLRQIIEAKINDKIFETTIGRILFNEKFPKEVEFINRPINSAFLKNLITSLIKTYKEEEIANVIDEIKDLGFWAETLSGGVSVSVFDCKILENKDKLIKEADKKIAEIEKNFNQGLITDEERKRLKNNVWIETTENLVDLTWKLFDRDNSAKIIIDSGGARASRDQVKQLSAMRGLVVDPLGKIVPLPTKSNFREGLSIFEYVTSARGSRKGLTDSALKTADAGYLTRRLIDVAHEAIIRIEDCKSEEGLQISKGEKDETVFEQKIFGRVLAENIVKPSSKKIILEKNTILDTDKVKKILQSKIESVKIRSPLTCQAKYGICQSCYGYDMSDLKPVEMGSPVGVLAAQSIGEPGTQLTLRVKHAGGIVGLDVTQGLPRVEELFEARIPKVLSPISEISGKVQVEEKPEGYKITVRNEEVKPAVEKAYILPLSAELRIKDKQLIASGEQFATGFLDLKEVLKIRGLRGAQNYLLSELQKVYESQGIMINDKHFEVIIRKMSDKVRIKDNGDSTFLIGEIVDRLAFEEENSRILASGGEPATAEIILIGISQVALHTNSWLSAASFENTSNVLTEAAIVGREDKLIGLKENVIIGRLIPTSPERARIEKDL